MSNVPYARATTRLTYSTSLTQHHALPDSQATAVSPLNGSSSPSTQVIGQQPPAPAGLSPLPQEGRTYPAASPSVNPLAVSPMPAPAQQVPQFPPGVALGPADQTKLAQAAPGSARPPSAAASQLPPGAQLPQQQQRQNAFPGSLSDLVMSFESVKQKGACLRVFAAPLCARARWHGLCVFTYIYASQRHTGCQTSTRCTSCCRAATRACRNHRTRRSECLSRRSI